MPVRMDRARVAELKAALPERPFDKQRRYQETLDLPFTLTSVLCPDPELCAFFEDAIRVHNTPKAIANYIANDLLRELSASATHGEKPPSVADCPVTPAHIAELAKLIEGGLITKQIGKEVFAAMYQSGLMPAVIVEKEGLQQSDNSDEIEALCREAIAGNAKAVAQFKAGNTKALNALKGPVMKATKGQANPATLDQILRTLIETES